MSIVEQPIVDYETKIKPPDLVQSTCVSIMAQQDEGSHAMCTREAGYMEKD